MGESRTSPRRLAAAERQTQALEFRKAGLSFPRIAQELGYHNPAGAFRAVEAALERTQQEPADAVRVLALERLDRMLAACWGKAIGGDLLAVDRVLKIEERRAKLLGLDAPDRVDILVRVRLMAQSLGLDPEAAVAEAERLVAEQRSQRAVVTL